MTDYAIPPREQEINRARGIMLNGSCIRVCAVRNGGMCWKCGADISVVLIGLPDKNAPRYWELCDPRGNDVYSSHACSSKSIARPVS